MFIERSVLEELRKGSYEAILPKLVDDVVGRHGEGAKILATFPDHVVVLDEDDHFYRIDYKVDGDVVELLEDIALDVQCVKDVTGYVGRKLREAVDFVLGGAVDELRNRLRGIFQYVERDGDYFLDVVFAKIDEATKDGENNWHTVYLANKDKIRGALRGNIRETEGRVPKTKYMVFGEERIGDFENELKTSMSVLKKLYTEIVDRTQNMVFDSGRDDVIALGPVRDSLMGEARAVYGLLNKVESLTLNGDLLDVAGLHDKLSERVKDAMIVLEYLNKRSRAKKENVA